MDQAVHYAQLTMQHAGPGPWKATTEEEEPGGPAWEPGAPGIEAEQCGAHSADFRLSGVLFGPPSTDPAADIKRVTKGWKASGLTVRTILDVTDHGGRYIEIAATDQTGGGPGYYAATNGTSIDIATRCSTDPSLREITRGDTPSPSPDATTAPDPTRPTPEPAR